MAGKRPGSPVRRDSTEGSNTVALDEDRYGAGSQSENRSEARPQAEAQAVEESGTRRCSNT